MNKIKELQKEARDKYVNSDWEDFFEYQDELIKETYNEARQKLIQEDIKRLEGKKKKETGFINMIFGVSTTKIPAHSDIDAGYNQAVEEEINYKKEQLK